MSKGAIHGIAGVRDALAKLGLAYSESWVRYACSSKFPGRPIPVKRMGWGVRGRVWVEVEDLVGWANEYKAGAPIATQR